MRIVNVVQTDSMNSAHRLGEADVDVKMRASCQFRVNVGRSAQRSYHITCNDYLSLNQH